MLSDEIKSLFAQRKRYGLNSDVARAVGLTPQSVGEWARGNATPSPEHWRALEHYFDLPAGRLADLAHRDNISAAIAPDPSVVTTQPDVDPSGELRRLIAEQARRGPGPRGARTGTRSWRWPCD